MSEKLLVNWNKSLGENLVGTFNAIHSFLQPEYIANKERQITYPMSGNS